MEDFSRCVCGGRGGGVSTDKRPSPKLALREGGSRGNIES